MTDVLDTAEAGPKVIRGSVIRIAGHVVGSLVSIAATALMIRHLGVIDAGRLVTVVALVAIVAGVSDLGLTGVGLREYSVLDPDDRRRFMRNLLGMRLAYTLAGVAMAAAFTVVAGYTPEMVWGTLLAGLGITLFVIQSSLAIPLSAHLRLGWVTGLQLAMQLLMAASTIVLVVLDAGLLPFLGVQVPAMVPVLLATALVVRRDTPLLPAFERVEWARVMREILPYAAAVAFGVIYFRLVTVIVSVLTSDTETGYFGASFRVLDAIALIPPLLVSTAFPVLARAARDDRVRLSYALTRVSEAMLIVGVWGGVAALVGAEFLIDLLAGPDFGESIPVLQLQAPAIAGTFLIATWGYGLLSLRLYRSILVCSIGAVALSTLLSVILIPWQGAEGAAVALTSTELALAIGYGTALHRSQADIGGAFRLMPRVFAAAAVAAAVPLALGIPSLAGALVATVVYLLLLVATKSVPVEIADAFKRQA